MSPAATKPQTAPADDLEKAIDRAIASCGGDPRATVGELLRDYATLEKKLATSKALAGNGFTRGWQRKGL